MQKLVKMNYRLLNLNLLYLNGMYYINLLIKSIQKSVKH